MNKPHLKISIVLFGGALTVYLFSALYQLHLVKSEIAHNFIPKEFKLLVEAFGYGLLVSTFKLMEFMQLFRGSCNRESYFTAKTFCFADIILVVSSLLIMMIALLQNLMRFDVLTFSIETLIQNFVEKDSSGRLP